MNMLLWKIVSLSSSFYFMTYSVMFSIFTCDSVKVLLKLGALVLYEQFLFVFLFSDSCHLPGIPLLQLV